MGNNKLTVKVVNFTATLFMSTSVLLWSWNLDNPMKYWLMQRKCNSKHLTNIIWTIHQMDISKIEGQLLVVFSWYCSPPPPVTFHSLRLSKPFPLLFNVRFRTTSILADLLTIKCLRKFPLKAPSPWKHSARTPRFKVAMSTSSQTISVVVIFLCSCTWTTIY